MRVAVTGAAGRIGRVVHRGLGDRGHQVIAMDVTPPMTSSMSTSGTPPLSCRCCVAAGVVHRLRTRTRPVSRRAGPHRAHPRVLEAMLAAGVPRIVYASSNHAVGFTPGCRWWAPIPATGPTRSTVREGRL